MEGNNDRKRLPNQDDRSEDQILSSNRRQIRSRSSSPQMLLSKSIKNKTIEGDLWTRVLNVDEIGGDEVPLHLVAPDIAADVSLS